MLLICIPLRINESFFLYFIVLFVELLGYKMFFSFFWIQVVCQIHVLQIHSPILWLTFHFLTLSFEMQLSVIFMKFFLL